MGNGVYNYSALGISAYLQGDSNSSGKRSPDLGRVCTPHRILEMKLRVLVKVAGATSSWQPELIFYKSKSLKFRW